MNPARKIDAAIIGVHQKVVNAVGKPTLWWGRLMTEAYVVLNLVYFGLRFQEMKPGALMASFVCSAWLYYAMYRETRSEVFWKVALFDYPIRVFLNLILIWILWTLVTVLHYGDEDLVKWTSNFLAFMTLYCYQYFRACQDPPPPQRRTKLATHFS